MTTTFGAPFGARIGCGKSGIEFLMFFQFSRRMAASVEAMQRPPVRVPELRRQAKCRTVKAEVRGFQPKRYLCIVHERILGFLSLGEALFDSFKWTRRRTRGLSR
jgi:hypothetical protein